MIDSRDNTIWHLKNECNHAKRYFRFLMESVEEYGRSLAERFLKEFGDKDYDKDYVKQYMMQKNEGEKTMGVFIKPTVGRVVLFISDIQQPAKVCAAMIVKVISDERVNLVVFDEIGCPISAQNVPLLQKSREYITGPYCRWMEYQKEQAAKEEVMAAMDKLKKQGSPLLSASSRPTMDFGDALRRLKMGHKVIRKGWNGKGMWLSLQCPDEWSMNTLPYIYIEYPAGHPSYPNGSRVPWLASQTDMLGDDWVIFAEGGA
jgi:hypothetical protein